VVFAADSEEAATTALNLGRVYRELGRLEDSARLMAEAVAVRRLVVARHVGHPDYDLKSNFLAQALAALGIARRRVEDYEGARLAYEESLALYRQTLGEVSENVAIVLGSLATLYMALDRPEDAEASARRALEIAREFHGAAEGATPHRDVGLGLAKLGAVLSQAGKLEEGGARLAEAVAALEASVGGPHRDTIDAALQLADHLERAGATEDRVTLLRRTLAWCEALEAFGSQRSLRCAGELAEVLAASGSGAEEAEALLVRGLAAAGPAVEALGWVERLERARAR
jgi:tetratricopeptide (TPR) repeat protein